MFQIYHHSKSQKINNIQYDHIHDDDEYLRFQEMLKEKPKEIKKKKPKLKRFICEEEQTHHEVVVVEHGED